MDKNKSKLYNKEVDMNLSRFNPNRRDSSKQVVQRFKPEKDQNGDILRRKILGTEKQYEKGRKIIRDREKEHERRIKALMRAQTNKDVLTARPKRKKLGSNAGLSSRGSQYTIVTRKTFAGTLNFQTKKHLDK